MDRANRNKLIFTHTAKGHFERASYLRPELPQDVESHVLKHDKDAVPSCRGHARLVPRMVQVVKRDEARRAQPLGKSEHWLSIVAARYQRMTDGMQ
jgi:hypothetical protein